MKRDPGDARHIFEAIRAGQSDEALALERRVPPSEVAGVRSFYDQLHIEPGRRACIGTSCWSARQPSLPAPAGATTQCLGRCYESPAVSSDLEGDIPRMSLLDEPVILRNLLAGTRAGLDEYALPDGAAILDAVEAAGLRGRGGAAYPTAAKWKVARDTEASERVVIANGDEGDPGSYIDRLLLEEDPHAVLAGMLACARAIGARRGVVFVRGEYDQAPIRMTQAIDQAESAGLLGANFKVEVIRGAGSYVAGEETALLAAIEGKRAEPRPKPPYPAESGLGGLPTVVQNIETLAAVPWVVRSRRRSGTKAFCLAGAVNRPGVVEAKLGISLRELLERGGGGAPRGRRWKMALVGGPMGNILPARDFDRPLDYATLPGLGHGGVVVLDELFTARSVAAHLFAFAAAESCGSCTPCRVGTAQLAHADDRLSLLRLLDTLEVGSLCGFGVGVPRPIRDLLHHFPDEVFR